MSKTIIFAIGGTGQLILHFYAQLFQIGAITDHFESVVVDSDALMPSLGRFSSFWDAVKASYPNDSVPKLQYIPVAQGLAGTVENALAGQALPPVPSIHPVEGFFDSVSLKQQVNEGLFARPALSAVMKTNWNQLPIPSFAGVHRVIVIGSLIGGTGGGLMAPLLNQIASRLRSVGADRPRLRAVLFGEYFRTDGSNQLVRDARERYPSNKLLVAYTIKELAPPELEHFVFVEPEAPVQRDTSKEHDPVNLAFPDQQHPLWEGLCAVEELRTNTTWPNTARFEEKERSVSSLRNYNGDMARMKLRVGVAHAVDRNSVITRLLREVWFDRFYGRGLPTIVARAFAYTRMNPSLGFSSIVNFAERLQIEFSKTWGEVRDVFPLLGESASLPTVRTTGWGDIRTDNPELIKSADGFLRSISANVLYGALRGDGL